MDQPLIMQGMATMGPMLIAANFKMNWDSAQVRPIKSELTIHEAYVPGLSVGTIKSEGLGNKNELGSFELQCPWELSLPYSVEAEDWKAMMYDMHKGISKSFTLEY